MAPERLSTDGYGASHPIETNDTLEGRARNRRVELTRE
jgi:chemotaxis protein MotB